MNELCVDIGYKSINHFGEQLCGDNVEIVESKDDSTIIVLADGLGSGVKACILSTLTSKIIATMMAAGMSIKDCVSTIAATLPKCPELGVAYSTFTIIRLLNNQTAELIQYDNPHIVLIRNGEPLEYPATEINIDGKQIRYSNIRLHENDILVAMSDGCPHAGLGNAFDFGWKRENIARFIADVSLAGYTANVLCAMLLDQCNKLYDGKPGDDATACVVRVRHRNAMNVLFGPPANRDDCDRMMGLFFSKKGKHIICGGTTSSIAADWLRKPIKAKLDYVKDGDIPPTAEIEGVDLVTEGVLTLSKVLSYAKDYLGENANYEKWSYGHDGASSICRLLFEEATDINFYVGKAMNPAYQNPDLPIDLNIKMSIAEELSECLKKMGKRINVSYF